MVVSSHFAFSLLAKRDLVIDYVCLWSGGTEKLEGLSRNELTRASKIHIINDRALSTSVDNEKIERTECYKIIYHCNDEARKRDLVLERNTKDQSRNISTRDTFSM